MALSASTNLPHSVDRVTAVFVNEDFLRHTSELVGGTLEMSNVDLAAEFTNLILAQRGFQASSKVITTSDQVLEDLVNIKR